MAESEYRNAQSNRSYLRTYFTAIMETASPGDVFFLISDTGKPPTDTAQSRIYRRCIGFDPRDTTRWHTMVYSGPRKKGKGEKFSPHFIHVGRDGTEEVEVPQEYFKDKVKDEVYTKCRLEIIHNQEVDNHKRREIVGYCRSQIGKPFDNGAGWRKEFMTYLLGIRQLDCKDINRVSCHDLAYYAYGSIGMTFPHGLSMSPNILGRVLGHPIGHPRRSVDLRYNYLRDHHLYRDKRFDCTLAVVGLGLTIVDVEVIPNPGKYSWSAYLQKKYGIS